MVRWRQYRELVSVDGIVVVEIFGLGRNLYIISVSLALNLSLQYSTVQTESMGWVGGGGGILVSGSFYPPTHATAW